MTENWDVILNEMLFGSLGTVLNLLKVMVPLMIVIELLSVYHILEKISSKLEFLGKPMGVSRKAIFPLLVGVIMGVTYGAGTLIEMNQKNPLGRRDFLLIGIFMVLCHGVIETGFLLGIAGANVIVVVGVRLLIAFAITCVCARLPYFRRMDN